MKFTIEKNLLQKSLDEVIKSIDSANIYIHLRNFYIDILDDMIIIKGSNGYFSIESKVENVNVESLGSILVPANLFLNIIRRCSGNITIHSSKDILYIENNKDKYEINLLDTSEYPNIDFTLYGNKIKVDGEKLKKAIENVIFASSASGEEMILTGVNIKYENSNLILTATDSFRLAREIIEIQDDRNINFNVTVTNKNLKNFIPADIKGEITLYANEHKINIIKDTTNFQSKIIDAPYKMVSQLFEIKYSKTLNIEKSVLNNAISKATVISSESSYNKINVIISKERISLSTQTDEIGRTSVIIDSNEYQYNGEEIEIVLNYKFLKDAISVFNDKIRINLNDSRGPIMIDSDDSKNKQIISPMAR